MAISSRSWSRARERYEKHGINFPPVERGDSLFCCLITLCLLCCVPSRALALLRMDAAWSRSSWPSISHKSGINGRNAIRAFRARFDKRRHRRCLATRNHVAVYSHVRVYFHELHVGLRGRRCCPASRLACVACNR